VARPRAREDQNRAPAVTVHGRNDGGWGVATADAADRAQHGGDRLGDDAEG